MKIVIETEEILTDGTKNSCEVERVGLQVIITVNNVELKKMAMPNHVQPCPTRVVFFR